MIIIYGYLFYYISALIGITIGYHRYFTHNNFKTNSVVETLFLLFGLICGGISALTWCAVHRYHHSTSDSKNDPHSPLYKGALRVIFSQWKLDYIPKKYIHPLLKNPRLRFFHKYGVYIYIGYALLTLTVSLNFFIILFLIPAILSWVGFGLLNYFAHKDGQVKDVPLMNILAPGEGWHRIHHTRPDLYKLHRFDIAGIIIKNVFIVNKK